MPDYTLPPRYQPPPTPEQAVAATEATLAAVARRERRWPRRWPADPPPPVDNTAAGDYAAWLATVGDAIDHDWAAARDPERYGRTFR